MNINGNVLISIRLRDGEVIVEEGAYRTLDAIAQLQGAIEELRRRGASPLDLSWGEQPPPVLAPSEEEWQETCDQQQERIAAQEHAASERLEAAQKAYDETRYGTQ